MLTPVLMMFATHASGAQAAGTVEVPFRTVESAMIVDAKVNGKDLSFMFDTGFSGWVTCDAGINLGKPDGKMTMQDFVGTFEVDTVKIKSLKLGSQNIPVTEDSRASLEPGEDSSQSYGTHVDGLMGFSVIAHTITEINFQNKKFVFYPKSFDITQRVPDNKRTFLAKLLPTGHNSLEMLVKTDGGSMKLALDTGNGFYATTHKEVLDRLKIWPLTKAPTFSSRAYVASGPVETFNIKMPKLSIYGVPVENSIWSIIDLPASGADSDGTVGFGFLKNFNILIDYERRRVWLENWTGKTTDEPVGETGMACFWDPKKKGWVVGFTMPGGPAEKAGIKVGDALLSVDGTEMLNIGYERMSKTLEGKVGTKVQLALSRKGSLYRSEVERVPLVNEPSK